MKQYPKQHQEQYGMVTPQVVNVNPSIYQNETLGGLDGSNIPVQSLTHLDFIAPTATTTITANSITTDWKGQTQRYKSVSRYNKDFGADVWTSLVDYDLKSQDWNKGWNRLTDISSGFSEVVLSLDTEEGMLNGCAQISYRHGFNVITDSSINYVVGQSWWTRWGVFVNDVLVAETGNCYPRLQNLVIPFSIPVGSQSVRIDLRWKSTTTAALNISGYTNDPTTELEIFGAEIWARNTYR